MENEIIVVSDHIEIHPTENGGHYAVVRDGSVYGIYVDLEFAQDMANELAENEDGCSDEDKEQAGAFDEHVGPSRDGGRISSGFAEEPDQSYGQQA